MCIILQAAALHLAHAEYDDISTLERMAILRGLCGLVLTTDAVRDVISARMDAISASLPKPKVATLSSVLSALQRPTKVAADMRCPQGHRMQAHTHKCMNIP